MSAHTPGPWCAKEIGLDDPLWDRWEIWPADSDDQKVEPVSTMVIGAGNARLMAAAPELLEACQMAARYLDPAQFPDAMRVIDAAIAKATGGAA